MMEEPMHTAGGILGSSSAAGAGAGAERWSSLPDDLLNIIYLGLIAGPVDRVRFAAVCRSWQAVASRHPPRHVLPWLILDPSGRDKAKHSCCLQAGAVLLPRFLLPSKAIGTRFVGSHDGGWVVASWGWDRLRIVNLFSGAETTLTPKQMSIIVRQSSENQFVPHKVILSSPPTSRHCILAAITYNQQLVICALGQPWRVCMPQSFRRDRVMDIAFCNGQLFCLMSATKEIVMFEATLDEQGVLVFSPGRLYIQNKLVIESRYLEDPNANAMYILELRGRLAVATMRTDGPLSWCCSFRRSFFLVFELVDATPQGSVEHRMYKWEEVTSLGNYALFLGPTCAKAIDVSTGEREGLHRNHIYYSHHRCYKQDERLPSNIKEFLTSSNNNGCRVYYKDDKSFHNGVKGIISVGYYVIGGDHPPMWMFPPDL